MFPTVTYRNWIALFGIGLSACSGSSGTISGRYHQPGPYGSPDVITVVVDSPTSFVVVRRVPPLTISDSIPGVLRSVRRGVFLANSLVQPAPWSLRGSGLTDSLLLRIDLPPSVTVRTALVELIGPSHSEVLPTDEWGQLKIPRRHWDSVYVIHPQCALNHPGVRIAGLHADTLTTSLSDQVKYYITDQRWEYNGSDQIMMNGEPVWRWSGRDR